MIPESRSDGLAESVDRLSAQGYTLDFRAVGGRLTAGSTGDSHPPEGFEVHEVLRFEGPSSPDDMAIVFALACREHGMKGTFVAAYGPLMPAADAEVVHRLQPKKEEVE